MSRPTHVLCSYPGMPTVRIISVHTTREEAVSALQRSIVGGYVMDLVYPEGSRAPVAGDVLDVGKPRGARMYGSVIAPQEAA